MMVCCCGRGMADVFGAFVKVCEVFEAMETWTQHSLDVLTSLVRFLSEEGVGHFDLITRYVADGSSEHQWQCLAHLGAGLGVSPRIFHIQGLHDRTAHFIGLSGGCCAIGGRGLDMHPPGSRSTGVFFTRARRVRPFWPPRVHVAATSSPLSELRQERQRRRRCHRRRAADMCPPAGFTPTIATPSMARAG